MTTPTAPQAQARPGIDSPMVYDDFIGKVSEDEKTWGLYVYHKLRRDRALYIAAKKSFIAKPNDEGLQEVFKDICLSGPKDYITIAGHKLQVQVITRQDLYP